MKKIINLAIVLAVTSILSYGQIDMGDTELNTSLTSIVNKYKAHAADFRHYVLSTYKVHSDTYDYMQAQAMNTGDIYLSVEIEKITKKKLVDVIATYRKDKAKGWGTIAKESGLTPGSPALERLKDDAYKLATGNPRPKPKPKPAAKPKAKTTTKPAVKTTTKTPSKTKPKTKPK